MSAAVETYRDDLEATYAVDFSRDREPTKKRSRFPEYKRRGSAPSRVSGMHCRRNKRWTWGNGRGARVLNMRAFAGAVAFAVASVASSVLGVQMDMVAIGNPGNPGNSAAGGLGAVAEVFQLSRYETTNQQYVDFLNTVGGSNPNGIFNSNMAIDALGGIVQDGSPGNFTYAVKSGTNPQGVAYANAPVNFVSWFSAARFVNWLNNGLSSDPATLETGAYTLNGQTTGALPSRNVGATFFLPSLNEWYKAAFHDSVNGGGNYFNWGLADNTKPDNDVTDLTLLNAANYGGTFTPTLGPLEVGSYAGMSSYGLFDMMGNIAEMTDTLGNNANRFLAVSGSYATQPLNFDGFSAFYSPSNVGGTATTGQIGFRVAAVPEPSTYALLAASAAGLGGFSWVKRRRRLAA
jgi:sulfatase modifying factor 1